ncbi:phage lytic enzyme [Stenotrophomonas phage Smp131]|uniref:Phage lytic enzyme n=1 Tax=Stenotrophomonas phage Smp131 TaxID=1168563 RepID=V9IQK6_9CAUD|nr:endolysin [Stenotrophomonas phage Smp131]AFJ75485.1 phage lytic enzyme [Stenotrophomonas phage Smp131]
MLTPALLAQIMQCPLQRAQRWAEALNAAMRRFGINTPVRAAYFLAQVGHESLSLSRVEESLSYSRERLLEVFGRYISPAEAAGFVHQPAKLGNRVYANRNGNGSEASGDGYLFRGRGPLQHTGRGNYRRIGQLIGQPLEEQPGLLIEPEIGAMAAAGVWKENGLNTYAGSARRADRQPRHQPGQRPQPRYAQMAWQTAPPAPRASWPRWGRADALPRPRTGRPGAGHRRPLQLPTGAHQSRHHRAGQGQPRFGQGQVRKRRLDQQPQAGRRHHPRRDRVRGPRTAGA